MAEIEEAPKEIGKGLGHKIGPLPVWGWAVAVVVVGGGAYVLIKSRQGGSGLPSALQNLPTLGGASGGGLGGSDQTTPAAPTTPTTATPAQIQTALGGVAGQLRLPIAQVQTYWDEFLNGTHPVGSTQAADTASNVVNAILTNLGSLAPTPQASQGVNANPYANNQSWLNSILAFLPQGTTGSVQNEIIALANGTTSNISQAAANALAAAEGIVGQAPTALSYTIGPPPAAPTAAPTLDSSFADTLVADYLAAQQKLGASFNPGSFWASTLSASYGIPASATAYVEQQSNQFTQTTGRRSTTAMLQNWLNQAYAKGLGG